MADLRDHMADDLAAVLADPSGPAVSIVLDGMDVRAFVDDLAFQDCPYDGVVLERKGVILLQGVISAPVPTQQMIMEEKRYLVESSLQPGPALELILTRFSS